MNWKKVTSEVKYENAWIKVMHEEVITPNNTKGIYGRVHFKNIAIAIVPIDEEGNTWLVGQHRYPSDMYSWEVVEGGGLLSEAPKDAAKRELIEEAGIVAKDWKLIHEFYTSNSVTDEKAMVYIARDLSFTASNPDDTELLAVKKIPLQKAIDMAYNNEITDSLAIIALMKTDYLIRKGILKI